MSRKERRAAERAARKAARKAGFPITTPEIPAVDPTITANKIPAAPPASESAAVVATPIDNHRKPNSAARLAANRANAQLSHGATSEAGKAISSQNHTIHGLTRHNGFFQLLPSEDPRGFEALKATLAEEHEPFTQTEAMLVNSMAESHWLAESAHHLQHTCFDGETGVITNEKSFSLYLRYQTTHTRAFHKSLNDLVKLGAERRKEEIGFEAQKGKAAERRLKNETQHYTNQLRRLDLLERDPLYTADFDRLTHAATTGSPDFHRLNAEFSAKYRIPEGASFETAA